MAFHENPFVFGEIIDDVNFVNRTDELSQLVRDLADGQKVFLLSPRRFGKSSLVALALLRLKKRHIHTVSLTVSSYSSYAQFLERFAEKVLRAAGPWERVKDWVTRFGRQVKPDVSINMATGEISLSLGKGAGFDPTPIAPDVFALPGELRTRSNLPFHRGGGRLCIERRFDRSRSPHSHANAQRLELDPQRLVSIPPQGRTCLACDNLGWIGLNFPRARLEARLWTRDDRSLTSQPHVE